MTDRTNNVAVDDAYCPQIASSVSKLCTWKECDRKFVLQKYLTLKESVDSSLGSIDKELQRGQRLKQHPHSVVFFVDLPLPRSLPDQTRAYVDDVRTHANQQMVLRNYVVDRTVDVIRRLNDDSVEDNMNVIDRVVEFCLLYQIGVDSLIGLHDNIEREFQKIGEMHVEYDKVLHAYEVALSNNDEEAMSYQMKRVSDSQYKLTDEVAMLQRLFNQIPFALAPVRAEHDFVERYGTDDSVAVHKFLGSDYTTNLIRDRGSSSLQNAYSKIKHHWRDFATERAKSS